MVAGVQRRDLVMVTDVTGGTLPYPPTLYASGDNEVLRGRVVVLVLPRDALPVRQMLRSPGEEADVIMRAMPHPPVLGAYELPHLVTGWLSPWHCGMHGARVQRRLNRAGAGRWRTRAVEVRRRQPGARAAHRKPQAAIVKQVRKAMRRLARETGR